MTDALLLHLSGPLQRWGATSGGGRVRATHHHPTRSGVIGMCAAALGRPPEHPNADLNNVRLTVRIDRPGRPVRDWHTVGGGQPKHRTVVTADGKPRGSGLIYEDWYLADAAFTLALHADGDLIGTLARAFANPVYPTYLARRNCPPDLPILLHRSQAPEEELHTLPLHRPAPTGTSVTVAYVHDQPPAEPETPSRYLDDGLDSAGQHVQRPVWDTEHELPAEQCAGWATEWLTAVHR